MGTGYKRIDTVNNIATGNIINASDLDAEYDALQAAFVSTTGHDHSGVAENGAPITVVGPVQDVVVSGSAVTPKTDNTMDLGSASLEFKNLFIDGTANIDSLVADTADINGGTIDGATINTTTINGSTNTLTNISLTTAVTGTLPIGNGGTNATTAPAARTNLGGTTAGSNFFTLTNPSAITFPRINADNTVSALDAATFRTAIGAGSGGGTVTSIIAGTGLTGGTITSSGTIAIDSTVTTNSGTQTLTNKRVTNRIGSNGATTSGNITPTSDTADQFNITGLTGTSAIQIPSGTPTDGQRLSIRIKDDGTGRTLSFVTTAGGYRVIGTTLPLTTTASKTIYVGCIYNIADSFWDVVAVATQA